MHSQRIIWALWRLQEVKSSDENHEINRKKVWTVVDIMSKNERMSYRWKSRVSTMMTFIVATLHTIICL